MDFERSRDLTDSTAVVTGGSRGIGLEVASRLADAGANLVLAARSKDPLEEAVEDLGATGAEAVAVPTDVTEDESVTALFDEARESFGQVDVLVNSAGVPAPEVPLWEVEVDEWRKVIDVNLDGAFRCTRTALRSGMLEREEGTILILSSLTGIVGVPRTGPYTVSKHGLQGMTSVLAKELRDTDIRISNLCPGQVDTEMTEGMTTVDRLETDDVADLAMFVLSRPSDAYVPQVVLVPPDSIPLVPQ
jgi:NAD(P)-dependent dehydrogenase (short-subunit alcohol dehydrogenase family)